MRIELDEPLTKTKLRQILKMAGKDGKAIKIIMGTEIFDIDTVVTKNETIYLCTDSKATSDFYEKRVIEDLPKDNQQKDYQDPEVPYKPVYYTITGENEWERKWEEYRKKHGLPKYYVGDTPGFGDDVTCQNQE